MTKTLILNDLAVQSFITNVDDIQGGRPPVTKISECGECPPQTDWWEC